MKKCALFLLFCFAFFMASTTYAATVEIANVSAHYAHPIFQTVEDRGNDSAIGQGMTESVLDPQALIETSGGQFFGTFRLHLKEQIGGYRLSVQNQGEKAFYAVSYTKMQDKEDFVDLRIPLPSKESIVRFDLDVKAMGRNVIFYGALLDRLEGNTDFVVSVSEESEQSEAPQTEALGSPIASEVVVTSSEKVQEETSESPKDLKGPSLSGKVGLLLKGDPRLSSEFNKAHNETDEAPYGPLTLFALYSVFIVLGLIAVLLFLLGLFLTYYTKRLRYKNDKEEEGLYDFEKMSSE